MRTSGGIVFLGLDLGQAQQGRLGYAEAPAEAHHGDALLAAGGPPALGLLVELGPAELGELLCLLDPQERGEGRRIASGGSDLNALHCRKQS
jgi:hypothetical protein